MKPAGNMGVLNGVGQRPRKKNVGTLILRISILVAAAQVFMAIGITPMSQVSIFHPHLLESSTGLLPALDTTSEGGVPNKATWLEDTTIKRSLVDHHALNATMSGADGIIQESPTGKDCHCVHCDTDEVCGGLWTGTAVPNRGNAEQFEKIHLLVSHCLHDLHWIADFAKGFNISSITIISKCGKDVIGAPQGSKIVRLENVGRCDHSYAYYLSHLPNYQSNSNLPTERTPVQIGDDKEIHVFLKDDRDPSSIHQPGSWRSFHEMLRISSERGFVCGMEPRGFWTKNGKRKRVLLSTYHITNRLSRFSMSKYTSLVGFKKVKYDSLNQTKEEKPFASGFANFREWQTSIPLKLPQPVTEVCYGGSFAATTQAVKLQTLHVWQAMEKSLSRADNLEEGHFAERSWAGLLSNPIADYQVRALKGYSTEEVFIPSSICGAFAIPRNLRVKMNYLQNGLEK